MEAQEKLKLREELLDGLEELAKNLEDGLNKLKETLLELWLMRLWKNKKHVEE